VRGWNGSARSPLADVRAALGQLGARYPAVPVALVGHSMGGRAAIYVAGERDVSTVIALAPWLEAGDPYEQLRGRSLLVVHGTRDRTTSARASAELVTRVQPLATRAGFLAIRHENHGMLHRPRVWHDLATGYVMSMLCGVAPEESVGGETAQLLAKFLAGEPRLDV
jgi:alpha-beta hydrolase superfamily lysophospholipase